VSESPEVLHGGVGNAGAVLRVGEEVLRPSSAHTSTIHSLLAYLDHVGFGAAPVVLGLDPEGRERLRYIPGDVPLVPFPAWSQTDEVLASVARLLRRYHDTVEGFTAPEAATWSTELADPDAGPRPVWCHNDLCPENVVFRNGAAVAMLDFEFAAPGRPLWDLAAIATMWIPLETDGDAARTGRRGLDPLGRLRVIADAYGLTTPERRDLVAILGRRFANAGAFVRRRVERGEAAFVEMWVAMGGQERYDRRARWFDEQRDRFVATLVAP